MQCSLLTQSLVRCLLDRCYQETRPGRGAVLRLKFSKSRPVQQSQTKLRGSARQELNLLVVVRSQSLAVPVTINQMGCKRLSHINDALTMVAGYAAGTVRTLPYGQNSYISCRDDILSKTGSLLRPFVLHPRIRSPNKLAKKKPIG